MALKRGAVKLAWTPFGGGNNSGVTVLVPLYYFSVSVVLDFLIFECYVLEWDVVSWSVDVDVAEAGRRCQQQTTKLCFSHSVCHHDHQLPLWNEWRWRGRWLKQFDGRRQHQRQCQRQRLVEIDTSGHHSANWWAPKIRTRHSRCTQSAVSNVGRFDRISAGSSQGFLSKRLFSKLLRVHATILYSLSCSWYSSALPFSQFSVETFFTSGYFSPPSFPSSPSSSSSSSFFPPPQCFLFSSFFFLWLLELFTCSVFLFYFVWEWTCTGCQNVGKKFRRKTNLYFNIEWNKLWWEERVGRQWLRPIGTQRRMKPFVWTLTCNWPTSNQRWSIRNAASSHHKDCTSNKWSIG